MVAQAARVQALPSPLLRSRRFLPLFVVQALGSLNDNLFKSALVVLLVFRGVPGSASLVALSGGLFLLPYLLFSSTAGQLADRFGKAGLIRVVKAAEIVLMLCAAWGLLRADTTVLLLTLFGLGTHSAFFGPAKYGILPELLAPEELLRGNALVEAGTFATILLGTIAGGAAIGLAEGPAIVGVAGVAVACAGLGAALAIPPVPPAAPRLRIAGNAVAETIHLVRAARADRPIWIALLALSWFWALGATFLAEFPILAQTRFGADNRVVTLLLASFTLGIGLGSILAGRLATRVPGGGTGGGLVAPAGAALSVCTVLFVILAWSGDARTWVTPNAMLTDPAGAASILALVGAAACGGVFSVPLYATLQRRAAPAERARMIAATNVVTALFVVAGAAVLAGLAALHVPPLAVLLLAAGLNLLVAIAAPLGEVRA